MIFFNLKAEYSTLASFYILELSGPMRPLLMLLEVASAGLLKFTFYIVFTKQLVGALA